MTDTIRELPAEVQAALDAYEATPHPSPEELVQAAVRAYESGRSNSHWSNPGAIECDLCGDDGAHEGTGCLVFESLEDRSVVLSICPNCLGFEI